MNKQKDKKETQAPSRKLIKILGIAAVVLIILGGLSVLAYNNKHYFIVAKVNDEYITRFELNEVLYSNFADTALNELVTKKLISQELAKEGITVAPSQIEAKIDDISSQIQAQQGMELEEYLETQNVSEEEFRDSIKIQAGIEQYFADEVDITEEEIDEFIETYGDEMPGESEEEKRAEAVDILINQEISSLFQEWLQEIRAEADIKEYIE